MPKVVVTALDGIAESCSVLCCPLAEADRLHRRERCLARKGKQTGATSQQRRCHDCRRKLGKGLCCQTESGGKEWRLGLGTGEFEESEVMLRTNHITLCWLSRELGDKRKWNTTQGNIVQTYAVAGGMCFGIEDAI